MEYKNLSLDEILAKVDAKYTRQEQNNIAFELVDSLMDSTDDLDDLKLAQVSAEYDNAKFILDTETNEVVWGKTDD